MTNKEFDALYNDWAIGDSLNSFYAYLYRKLGVRSVRDKIPRCLMCGTCIPTKPVGASIYSEFCTSCSIK